VFIEWQAAWCSCCHVVMRQLNILLTNTSFVVTTFRAVATREAHRISSLESKELLYIHARKKAFILREYKQDVRDCYPELLQKCRFERNVAYQLIKAS